MLTRRQAASAPMLTEAEESELVGRWKSRKDPVARDRLVTSHVRICYKVASIYESNEERIRDLAQEGVFGLMKAVDAFDPERNTRFGSYARWWVHSCISTKVAGVATVVDVPPRMFLAARGGGMDDDGLPWMVRQAARGDIPLDAPIGTDSDETVMDRFQDPEPDPETNVMIGDRAAYIHNSVENGLADAMSDREAEVLRRRSLTEEPDTLEKIAGDLHVSRERVRQIEKAARSKLKRYLVNTNFSRAMLRPC